MIHSLYNICFDSPWKGQPYLIALRKKFPALDEILSIYATIVFLVYAWASVAFFWKLPSWLHFLTFGEIAAIVSYILASSLLESTIILLILLFASLLLPSRWLSYKFVVRGSVIIYSLTFWVALFDMGSLIQLPTSNAVISLVVGLPLMAGLAMMLADRISLVPRFMTTLANRLTIFLYLWLPLSLAGIFVLFFRIF